MSQIPSECVTLCVPFSAVSPATAADPSLNTAVTAACSVIFLMTIQCLANLVGGGFYCVEIACQSGVTKTTMISKDHEPDKPVERGRGRGRELVPYPKLYCVVLYACTHFCSGRDSLCL